MHRHVYWPCSIRSSALASSIGAIAKPSDLAVNQQPDEGNSRRVRSDAHEIQSGANRSGNAFRSAVASF
jgi:hypothetical protein